MPKDTKKSKKKKIKSGILGSGSAQNAANKLKGRKAQLAEQERIAMGGKPKKGRRE